MNSQKLFTLKQKEDSFLQLQSTIIENQKNNTPFLSVVYRAMKRIYVEL